LYLLFQNRKNVEAEEKTIKIENILKIKHLMESFNFRKYDPKRFKPMLAVNFNDRMKCKGHWASEKLDGVRVLYHKNKFYTRTGNQIYAPDEFIGKIAENVPENVVLDGELFTKRNDFSNILSIVSQKKPRAKLWTEIKFHVFDIANVIETFEVRQLALESIPEIPVVVIIKQTQLNSIEHLQKLAADVIDNGGEGVMIRKSESYYENARSDSMIKYKQFHDGEVVVKEILYGSGKYSNVMGSLVVEWLNLPQSERSSFSVGSGFSDNDRKLYKTKFPIGTILKIKYFEVLESGAARFPVYLSIIPPVLAH